MSLENLKYAKTHEWVHLDGDIATVGISAFAVEELTDLVFIDLPEVGKTFAVGDVFGEVESVKAVSELFSPVSGEVVEVNSPVADDLGILSEDPYTKGWLMKIKIGDAEDVDKMMDQAAYDAQCTSESH